MLVLFFGGLLAHAGEFKQLHAAGAESSSFLKSSWNKYNENYHPNYVLDDNPKTAWVEGAEGNGETEKIVVPISSVDKVAHVLVKIRNGYQKSKGLLRANSAPKDVTIRLLSRAGVEVSQSKASLEKQMGWQEVKVAVPSLDKRVGLVELTIDSVHTGSKYKDTCISDMEVWIDSQSEYKPMVEAHKKDKLLAWVSNRVADAKYFANKPKEYPFVATQFAEKWKETSKEVVEKHLAPFEARMKEAQQKKVYYSRENKNKVRTMPDYLHMLPKDLWRLSDLALFETKKKHAIFKETKEIDNEEGWSPPSKDIVTNFFRLTNADGSISHLYYEAENWTCERTCYGYTKNVLARYEGDRLVQLFEYRVDDGGEPESGAKLSDLYTFHYKNDKVERVALFQRHSRETWIPQSEWQNPEAEEVIWKSDFSHVEFTPSAG